MTNPPPITFSIIINNYNYAEFLEKSIRSALNQSYEFVDVIVVDDGSTDSSLQIAQKHASDRCKVIAQSNAGQNEAIRRGLSAVTGEYVLILDSDDALLENTCAEIVAAIGNTRPQSIHFQLQKIDKYGQMIGIYPEQPFISKDPKSYLFLHGTVHTAPTSGNVYRREFLIDAFQHVKIGTFSSDGFLAMASAATGEMTFIKKVLGKYLVHGGNVSQRTGSGDAERIKKNHDFTLDHYRNLKSFLDSKNINIPHWYSILNAYSIRRTLYFKLKYNSYRDISYIFCFTQGIKKFFQAKHYGSYKQFKNILLITAGTLLGVFAEIWRS